MERIHVTVRARPISGEDAKLSPWRISGDSIFIHNPNAQFDFDRILAENCPTVEVYESRTKEIVGAAVRGFNGTVFAYGQTNSGKTHTMRGSASEPGVIPLAVRDLFDTIHQEVDREFLLRMSYMEIYNEEINDLLAPEHRKLQIHENLERGIYVAGLREEIVTSPEQVLSFMEFGESHRHIGETNMNIHSSRSHTIFRMIIESKDKTEDEDVGSPCDAVRVSVLNLVDLAGSERVAKTGAEGARLKEGSHINKSLMTLGTVIKKLSEGAESQGGHVPYRDSKLTRILQPALGGNANTAIICNITLALIHADETKSSLQFASRALCVKNCAHVNEILTDAALLKRQKKEIEELRAKLQGSHSTHLGDEILNLRNTLLQTELERERIALELEEERKAQAEWEKRVRDQEKKIENLSSMVLSSNRDENRERLKKEKRRDTWCPGNLSRETIEEVYSNRQSNVYGGKLSRSEVENAPLLPFEELMHTITEEEDDDCKSNASEDYKLPDPCALLRITSRRKFPPTKKNSPSKEDQVGNTHSKVPDFQAEYEDLLIKFETQRTENEYLTRRLADCDSSSVNKEFLNYYEGGTINESYVAGDKDSEANVVIERLQEQIKMLEMEKVSNQKNLASIVELTTEQNVCARQKCEELYGKLFNAREEARVAQEQLTSNESVENSAFMIGLLTEIQDVVSEVQDSKMAINEISSLLDDSLKNFPSLIETILEFKGSMCQILMQEKDIISNHERLNGCLMSKVSELENENCVLRSQTVDLQNQMKEVKLEAQNSEQSLRTLLEQQDLEKEELITYIQSLEKELSSVSSCSLVKEKESLRKEFEKTRTKLKDTESKLKNAMQEKTKLEGAKAFAEREIKRLNGQNSLLECDINRRESFVGRRRDSVFDKNPKMCDSKKYKTGSIDQTIQEEYKKMEVYVFEMEAKIASLEDLEDKLSVLCSEKEEILSRNDYLASQLESLSKILNTSNEDMNILHEEITSLRQKLEDSTLEKQQLESCIKSLMEEKEELSMQLGDSLLEMEEEKAVWSAKERDSIEAIEEKTRLYNSEIVSLSTNLSQARSELESCTQDCEILRERLTRSEEEKAKNSKENISGVDELRNERECLKNELLNMTEERNKLQKEIEEQKTHTAELGFVNRRSHDMLQQANVQVEELSRKMEVKMRQDQADRYKEMMKLKMRLRWTQAKLDSFRELYIKMVGENELMNNNYETATKKLKEKLAAKGLEVLKLKKVLAEKESTEVSH